MLSFRILQWCIYDKCNYRFYMCQRGMSVQELPDLIIFTDTINIDVVHIFLITCIFSKTLYFLLNALKKNLDIFNETQISCRITSQMNV